jgi:2-polyprenyl-3-methyl-5-hydroxy-6-metoxy-1,4-benzoquinol methylase
LYFQLSCTSKLSVAQHNAIPLAQQDDRPLCAICSVRRDAPLVVRKGYQVVRCRLCGLVYVSPRPRRRGELDELYTNARYSSRQVAHVLHEGRTREAQWRLDQLESYADRRGTLLDVGCSAGSFLLAARERGWDVHGIDISPAAVRHASSALDLDARVATLEDAPFAPRSFDAITIFECIEHMLQPRDALQAAWRLLKDDGVLLITTPNIDGFVPRVTYLLLGRTIGAWEHPTPPHHLYQFSRRTLDLLLRQARFRVASCATRPMGLRYTVKQLESAIVEVLHRRLREIQALLYGPTSLAQAATNQPGNVLPQDAAGGGHPRSTARHRSLPRRVVTAFCWALTTLLYAVPVRALGIGDSMVVAARKSAPTRQLPS